ncbi:unnamed protein product [Owenia fusiformis]|uniref:DnaJ homolog subfamily C member 1 n=1 Tax=Owenia fusiformis TaxID=6347 RepID=A0A8S4P765_OWEFU|nr:unnamed protein product [Owenia fusiformis]
MVSLSNYLKITNFVETTYQDVRLFNVSISGFAMAGRKKIWTIFIVIFLLISPIKAWDTDELELFDIVEEVNQNFYELMGLEQSASTSEIRKAYRKLSLQLHPDKNKEEDAEIKFRQLVAVYEVLKNAEKRQRYNEVLEHGLPDWRQPVYYYRKMRKMGLLEMSLLLLVILTVGQFAVVWAAYFEKKFEMEEVFRSMKRKAKKTKRKQRIQEEENDEIEDILQEELSAVPRPKLIDLLPLKLVRLVVGAVIGIPGAILEAKARYEEYKEEKRRQKEEEELELEEANAAGEVVKRPKKRQRVVIQEYDATLYSNSNPVIYNASADQDQNEVDTKQITTKNEGEWTDEHTSLLAKAAKKFPGGVSGRWQKIAEFVGRPVSEVITHSKKMKAGFAVSIDPSAQGIVGAAKDNSKILKKGSHINPDIYSRNEEDIKPLSNGNVSNTSTKSSANTNETTQKISKSSSNNTSSVKSTRSDGAASTEVGSNEGDWSQNQQKILEWALGQFPKGTEARWDKVAEHIPGKTKDECVTRVKFLLELVKKRKAATTT